MDLLERDACLRDLDAALADAAGGAGPRRPGQRRGRHRQDGAGRALRARAGRRRPRAVGRLRRAVHAPPARPAARHGRPVPGAPCARSLTADADRAAVFAAVLAELQGRPTIAVVEDVHWADEATLDLLRFLGRRIARTTALLVLTYRDDELGPRHPLRTVLGDLAASPAARRLPLAPLSEQAVRALVGARPIDAAALHRRTGGNPFFVTEALAGGGGGRAAHRPRRGAGPRRPPVAVGPRRPAGRRRDRAAHRALAAGRRHRRPRRRPSRTAWRSAMLVAQGEVLAFRHELARQAVLESISPPHRVALHRMALDALTRVAGGARRPGPAGAPRGGRRRPARRCWPTRPPPRGRPPAAGAHREAAALYALALRCRRRPAARRPRRPARGPCLGVPSQRRSRSAPSPAGARRPTLWQRGRRSPCGRARTSRYWPWRSAGAGSGTRPARPARPPSTCWRRCRPGASWRWPIATQAMLHQYNHDLADAIALAERAIALAERAGDARVLAMAYDTLGLAWMYLDFERGRQHLERALAIAREAGLDARVATRLRQSRLELVRALPPRPGRALPDRRARLYRRARPGRLPPVHGRLAGRRPPLPRPLARGRRAPPPTSCARPDVSTPTAAGRRWSRSAGSRRGGATPPRRRRSTRRSRWRRSMGELPAHRAGPRRPRRGRLAGRRPRRARRPRPTRPTPIAVDKRHPWVAGELAFWRWRAGERGRRRPDWLAEPVRAARSPATGGAAAELGAAGLPVRAGARAGRRRRRGAGARRWRSSTGSAPGRRRPRLRRALRAGGAAHIPRGPRAGHARQPVRPDRPPGGDPRPARRRAEQRRDRRAAVDRAQDSRPPRRGGPGQAGCPLPARTPPRWPGSIRCSAQNREPSPPIWVGPPHAPAPGRGLSCCPGAGIRRAMSGRKVGSHRHSGDAGVAHDCFVCAANVAAFRRTP